MLTLFSKHNSNMKSIAIFFILTTATFALEFEEGWIERLNKQNKGPFECETPGIENQDRNGRVGEVYRWPGGRIPYVIDDTIQGGIHLPGFADLVKKGMSHYHEKTCIKFVPRTIENDYIRIYFGKGCSSHIGRTGGSQPVSLGDTCLYTGTVIHELGHAVGFYHEQSRSDRDEYLNIFLENVKEGHKKNFDKLDASENILYNDFDYDSIMIYGNTAFSKDKVSHTMEAKNGQKLLDPLEKHAMTESDIYRVNKMYNCP